MAIEYIAIDWHGVKSLHFFRLSLLMDAVYTCTIPGMWHIAIRLILTPLQWK